MYARAKQILTLLAVLFLAVPLAGAQQYAPQGRATFSQQQLDQMLAPIALYPDALLSQILMASTYPREVTEAASWSRRNPGLNGDRAVRAADEADWDPSVKSLVAFPQILDMMDEKLNWTEDLGDAFLDQEAQVMDTVQYLRRKAYTAGSLSSSDQYRVDLEDSSFVIRFSNPEVVYLPYYNPTIVYGTWWWPAYQPVYWAPWPGYYSRAGYARGYAWGPAIPVSRGFFFGAPDWRQRRVNVVNVNNYYYRPVNVSRPAEAMRNAGSEHVWQHDTAHRRDAPYRNAGDASSRHAATPAGSAPEVRRDQRERDAAPGFGRGASANVPAPAPAVAAQPATRSQPERPNTGDSASRGWSGRDQAAREHDRPSFEGRGENGRRPEMNQRPESRVESGNRHAQRDNTQAMVASTNVRPLPERASTPAPAPAFAREPAPRAAPAAVSANAQPAVTHAVAEQRPAAPASRAEARPAGGRDRSNNSTVERGDNGNSRRP
jgi:hypothetical protein